VAFDRHIKYWLPVILWMGVIFWMSTETFSAQNTSLIIEPVLHFLMPGVSGQNIDIIHGLIRKFGHVTEYFILGLLLLRAFRAGSPKLWSWRWAFFAITVVLFYAVIDEFHQSFVSTRTASIVDIGIDIAGGIFSQAVCALLQHRGQT
jgi:VanZ family protein